MHQCMLNKLYKMFDCYTCDICTEFVFSLLQTTTMKNYKCYYCDYAFYLHKDTVHQLTDVRRGLPLRSTIYFLFQFFVTQDERKGIYRGGRTREYNAIPNQKENQRMLTNLTSMNVQ